MEITLDCGKLTCRASAHPYLKQQFGFPDYYGNNLDALYDCLTGLPPCRIVLTEPARLYEADGFGAALLETIRDAVRDNPGLELVAGNGN